MGVIKSKIVGQQRCMITEVNLNNRSCRIYDLCNHTQIYEYLIEKYDEVTYEDMIANPKGYYSEKVNKIFLLYWV